MRDFCRSIAILLVIFTLTLMVSACGTPTPAAPTVAVKAIATTPMPQSSAPVATLAPTKAPAVPTAATAPAPYGELRVGLANFGGGAMDPTAASGPSARYLSAAIFDSLVGITVDGRAGPGIAEKWDMSSDAKIWTFYIRKSVKFHDGTDLTAADVKYSIERILAPEALSSYAASLRGTVDKVELKDDYTVVMTLKKPDPEIWKWLSLFSGGEGMVMPKKYIEEKGVDGFRAKPIGSGPWKLVKYDNNVELQVEAFDSHWRAKPQFKKVTIRNIPEEGTRVAMLKTGELDLIQISPEKANEIKTAGLGLVSVEAALGGAYATYPDIENPSAKAIGDIRVRKALSLSINRPEISDRLFAGYSKPSAVAGMSSTNMYFDPDLLKPDPYDPNQAKALLAQAGYASGFGMKIISNGATSWMNLFAEAVAGYWEKIGVKTVVNISDTAALRPQMFPVIHPDLKGNAITWQIQPWPYFGMRATSYASAYHKNHTNKELDALIDKTEATLDPAERRKVALQAALAVKNEYAMTGVVEVAELLATGKNVSTWTPMKGYSIPGLEYERIQHAK